jgi:hypothetical protein
MLIVIEDVADLYGFEFEITYDPTLLEVVDADPAREGVQIRPGDFLSPDWELQNRVDNDRGRIAYALSQRNPSQPVSGDGTLAVIAWRAKATGTSPIALIHVLLAAPAGVEIPVSPEDGRIVVASSEAPPADTPETAQTITSPPQATTAPTATPIPPTATLPATAVPEATQGPTATTVSAASGAATGTAAAALASTPLATATPVPEAMETPLPTVTPAEPIKVTVSGPAPTREGESSSKPSPTTVSSSGSSGVPTSTLISIAVACLLAAAGALVLVLVLQRRR